MKATKFDQKFEAGENVTGLLDMTKARRPGVEVKRVNVDFPEWMVRSIDRHARRLGITRQSLIKIWLAEALEAR
ncbi:MAG: type II toxin-antitoxin system BrnA family antitoxin [Steroidobacteraceae bacterium]